MNKKTWYLQQETSGLLSPFWDDHVHVRCRVIKETSENPFVKKKETD